MSLALIIVKQIVVMFLLMMIGYCLYKKKMITLQGNKELGTFLIYIILPASIIRSYITELTSEKLIGLLISFLAAVMALTISILISRLAYGYHRRIEHFGVAFSNAGFIGIPLVKSVVGDQAVFYIAAFVALLNLLQWTYGVMVMSQRKDAVTAKKIVKNPIIISLVIGLGLFISQLPVPVLLTDTLSMVGNMTAPVAMITLGVYLAQMKLREIFNDKWIYFSAFLRLLLIPLITLLALSLVPTEYKDIKLTVLIACAAPVGSNVAIFAQLNGLDYTQAIKCICLSTILSIISMPIIVGIAGILW